MLMDNSALYGSDSVIVTEENKSINYDIPPMYMAVQVDSTAKNISIPDSSQKTKKEVTTGIIKDTIKGF
jgi:hypothetical protein